jgi:hypothetical protein
LISVERTISEFEDIASDRPDDTEKNEQLQMTPRQLG